MRARGARRCTLLVAVNVAPVPYDVAEIDPHPEFDAATGGTSTFRSAISRCTSSAQRTASTTLPTRSAIRPRWCLLRVPYPLSFYAKGLDGRIDDANAGWKGRGVWTTSGDRAPWLKEGGKGTVPVAFHFQFRPNPLSN